MNESPALNLRFRGRYLVRADLRCVTGLHIGAAAEGFEIGGMDNPVIKDPLTGYPYIPGSSLKGKMRSLLEWAHHDGQNKVLDPKWDKDSKIWKAGPCELPDHSISIVFGCSAANPTSHGPTRLTVRDAFPKGLMNGDGTRKGETERDGTIQKWQEWLGEGIYTEIKSENAIDRITSEANPRPMERVPADSVFEVEMSFDVYAEEDITERVKLIFQGMWYLEDSALGGGGSRGAGRVQFENLTVETHGLDYYGITVDDALKLPQPKLNGKATPRAIYASWSEIWPASALDAEHTDK